jgi:hypothetical protein
MRNYGLLTLGFGAVAAAIMGQGASDDQVTIAGAFGAGALLTSIAFVFDAGDYAEARRTERYYIREADRRVEALREGARRPR